MNISAVTINILGQSFKIASPEDQVEALKETAADLEQRLLHLRARSSSISTEQLFLMVSLNLCHDLRQEAINKQEYARTIDLRIEALQQTIEQALQRQSGSKLELDQVKTDTIAVKVADTDTIAVEADDIDTTRFDPQIQPQ